MARADPFTCASSGRSARLRRKIEVDAEIVELPLGRRWSAACRRASDVFLAAHMMATHSLLREVADAVDAEARYAADFLEGDDE
jgi:hypothetical protein